MRNIIGPFKRLITSSYDLKGSTMNREVKIDDKIKGTKAKFFFKKDLNFNKEIDKMNLKESNDLR